MLRIHLDGSWTAEDFGRFYLEVQYLANYFETESWGRGIGVDAIGGGFQVSSATAGQPLEVRRIEFSSPGFTDLIGLAGVLEQIRLFIQYLADLRVNAPDRELSREERRLTIAERRIAIISNLPDSFDEKIRRALESENTETLMQAVFDRRVVGVETED